MGDDAQAALPACEEGEEPLGDPAGVLFLDLENCRAGNDFLRVENELGPGCGELLAVDRVDRASNDLDCGVPVLDGEDCREVCIPITCHDKRYLERGKAHQHIGRGDVALVRIIFLVAEMTYPGVVLVHDHHALLLFQELHDNVVTVRAAAENTVFCRSRLLKRGWFRHVTEDVLF